MGKSKKIFEIVEQDPNEDLEILVDFKSVIDASRIIKYNQEISGLYVSSPKSCLISN